MQVGLLQCAACPHTHMSMHVATPHLQQCLLDECSSTPHTRSTALGLGQHSLQHDPAMPHKEGGVTASSTPQPVRVGRGEQESTSACPHFPAVTSITAGERSCMHCRTHPLLTTSLSTHSHALCTPSAHAQARMHRRAQHMHVPSCLCLINKRPYIKRWPYLEVPSSFFSPSLSLAPSTSTCT